MDSVFSSLLYFIILFFKFYSKVNSTFKLIREQLFNEEVVDLGFDCVHQVFIIGFIDSHFNRIKKSSIYELDLDLIPCTLLSEQNSLLGSVGVNNNINNNSRYIVGNYFDRTTKPYPSMKLFLSDDRGLHLFTPLEGNTNFRTISFIRLSNDSVKNIVFVKGFSQVLQDSALLPLRHFLSLPTDYVSAIADLRDLSSNDSSLPEILVSTKCGSIHGFRDGKQCFHRDYLPDKKDIFWMNKNITNQIITRKFKGDYYTLLINGPNPQFMYRGKSSLIMLKNYEVLWTLDRFGDFGTIADLDNDGEDELACFGRRKHPLAFTDLKSFRSYSILKDIYSSNPVVVWQEPIHEGVAHYPFKTIFAEDIDQDGKLELITATSHAVRIFKFKY